MFGIRNYRRTIISIGILFIIIVAYQIILSANNYYENIQQSNFYSQKTIDEANTSSIQRAILVYYPAHQENNYAPEIRWLYRSWIEMIEDESPYWRTDLIIYTGNYSSIFQQLGCILNQKRMNQYEPPKCRVFLYLRLLSRLINNSTGEQNVLINSNLQTFFQINLNRSIELVKYIFRYDYIDSVNIIAEAYPTFKMYDFILKTDIDVFITKQFAQYIPKIAKSILVGLGGYSAPFNNYRLSRIARDMNWKYKNMTNIGSTWYGAADYAQRIADLTLDAMLHLSKYEFFRAERESKFGTLSWPDWHYGVLSMYGTHLAVNHLILAENIQVTKADTILDQSTTNSDPTDLKTNNRLHLHCWHSDKDFSKFKFKMGKYNATFVKTITNSTSAQGYAMRMAWESQQMTLSELSAKLSDIISNKIV